MEQSTVGMEDVTEDGDGLTQLLYTHNADTNTLTVTVTNSKFAFEILRFSGRSRICRRGCGVDHGELVSREARDYNGCLGARTPAVSRGRAPCESHRGEAEAESFLFIFIEKMGQKLRT